MAQWLMAKTLGQTPILAISHQPKAMTARSAGHRPRDTRDLLAGMAIVDAEVHPADPLADGGVLDLQEVREVRRPYVIPRVRRAQQERQLAMRQVRMLERRRVAVELLPVGFGEERL